jgi:hypothetical protein
MDGIHTRSSSLETVEQTLHNSQTGNRKENEKKTNVIKKKPNKQTKSFEAREKLFPLSKTYVYFLTHHSRVQHLTVKKIETVEMISGSRGNYTNVSPRQLHRFSD